MKDVNVKKICVALGTPPMEFASYGGVPVLMDPLLGPNTIEFRDGDGRVLYREQIPEKR